MTYKLQIIGAQPREETDVYHYINLYRFDDWMNYNSTIFSGNRIEAYKYLVFERNLLPTVKEFGVCIRNIVGIAVRASFTNYALVIIPIL